MRQPGGKLDDREVVRIAQNVARPIAQRLDTTDALHFLDARGLARRGNRQVSRSADETDQVSIPSRPIQPELAVIEGIGDHGCEYMTGGRVVVLGQTGRNFAADMSGGIAYILDSAGDFRKRCNMGMVELESVSNDEDIAELRQLIENHAEYTGSTVAQQVLENWQTSLPQFVKVMPTDYKRVLRERAAREAVQTTEANVA